MSNWQVVIPSFGRAGRVRAINLFPDALIVVPQSQQAEYLTYYKQVMAIPDDQDGTVAKKRNAILDRFDTPILMLDDDVIGIIRMADGSILTKEETNSFVDNAFELTSQFAIRLWGLNPVQDKMKWRDFQPFSFTKPVYCGVGVTPSNLRYDERFALCEDVDFYLAHMLEFRKLFRFNSYCWTYADEKVGGISLKRKQRQELYQTQYKLLQAKWGRKLIEVKDGAVASLAVHAPIKGL